MANKTVQLEKTIADLREMIDSLQHDLKKKDERIDYLIRQLFGRKSEKLDPNQLRLLLGLDEQPPMQDEDPEDDPPPCTPGPKRKRRHFKDRLPEDFPIRTEYVDPPCPSGKRALCAFL